MSQIGYVQVLENLKNMINVPPTTGTVTGTTGKVGGEPPVQLNRDPPPLLQHDTLPTRSIELLRAASAEVFGIPLPRSFQYAAKHHCVCNNDTVLVVPQRTAEGKTSLILCLICLSRQMVS